MNPDDPQLEALASRVLEGEKVDWAAAESSTSSLESSASIRALRQVSRIAEFNRTLQRAGMPPLGATPGASLEPARWGSLLLLERVGLGANGEVWRAWDPRLQREVALKFLQGQVPQPANDAASSPLLDEARALAKVRHPNVVAVHGIDAAEGRAGMWMEFLAGTSLADAIERQGKLPAAEVMRIGRDLSRALAAVHAAGLVHRDLKPANVVLENDSRVVLTDFGLGQQQFLAASEPVRVSGTPMFMAPERLAGGPATALSDQYALGVTLWCALAGSHPFSARTLGELEAAVRKGPARSLAVERPDAPIQLVQAIERAMASDPGARFADTNALLRALETASSPVPAGFISSKIWLPRGLAIAAALLIAAGAWVVWRARSGEHARPSGPAASNSSTTSGTSPLGAVASLANPAPYDVEASIVRRGKSGDERLAAGDRVSPGDRLSLEFHATQKAWVYVLNEDERGESYLLFPQPLFDVANPITPDSMVVLPGTIGGRENAWTVTSRGGREHFLVIASPAPVPEIEAELSKLPAARPDRPVQYAAIAPATVERLRGVGGVAALPEDLPRKRAGTFERFSSLAGRETGVRGVWVRSVTLANPLH